MSAPEPPATSTEVRRGRVLLFVHLLLSPLVFDRGALDAFEYPKVLVLMATAVLLVGGAVAGLLGAPGARWAAAEARLGGLRREPAALGVALFLVSAAVSTVTSISPRTSYQGAHQSYAGLNTIAAYTVLFFGTRALCVDLGHFRRLFVASGLAVAASSAYAVLQVAGLDPLRWGGEVVYAGVRRTASTMGHPNHLGGFLVMALPAVACLALGARRDGRRLAAVAWAATGVLAVGVVVVGLSRGAWLALTGTAILFGIGWAHTAGGRRWLARAAAAGVLVSLLVAAGLAALPGGRQVAHGLVARIHTLAPGGAAARDPRWSIWRSAVDMFQERPLFGVGLDAFQLGGQRHRSLEYWRSEGHRTPAKAHNEPMHVLATQGLTGAVAAALLLAGLVRAFARALREHPADRDVVLAAGAGVVAFLLQGLFSFAVAGCATLFATYAALLSRAGEARAAPTPAHVSMPQGPHSTGRRVVWALSVAVVYFGILLPMVANRRCRRGFVLHVTGSPSRALADLQRAAWMDPSKEVHWATLGAANEAATNETTDSRRRRALLEASRDAFQRARDLVPANAYNYLNLGRVLSELGRDYPSSVPAGAAPRAFEEALARDPRNPYLHAAAGRAALDLGDLSRAQGWASRCLGFHPRFGPCLWIPAYVALAEAMDPARGAAPAERHRRLETAAALLNTCLQAEWSEDVRGEAQAASQLAAVLIMLGRPLEAREAAARAVAVNPGFADGRFNLAKAHERLGQRELAAAEYRQVLHLRPGYGPAVAALAALGQRPPAP
jgi:O-antigen ligase